MDRDELVGVGMFGERLDVGPHLLRRTDRGVEEHLLDLPGCR